MVKLRTDEKLNDIEEQIKNSNKKEKPRKTKEYKRWKTLI